VTVLLTYFRHALVRETDIFLRLQRERISPLDRGLLVIGPLSDTAAAIPMQAFAW
jgi:hypothetical protein